MSNDLYRVLISGEFNMNKNILMVQLSFFMPVPYSTTVTIKQFVGVSRYRSSTVIRFTDLNLPEI